jgi:hypothetical protein
MNRRDALIILAVTALLPKGSNAETRPVQFLQRDSPTSIILRDAPLQPALQMLLGAYGLKGTVEDLQGEVVSLWASDQPLERQIELVKQSARGRVETRIENGVYKFAITPEVREPLTLHERLIMAVDQATNKAVSIEKSDVSVAPAPRTVLDIPRRVCGVLSADAVRSIPGGTESVEDGVFWALVETVERDDSRSVRIVRGGDHLGSGLPDTPDLRVESISRKGVILETGEGDVRFLVQLRGMKPDLPPRPQRVPARPVPPQSAPWPPEPPRRPTQEPRPIPGMRSAPKPKVKPPA